MTDLYCPKCQNKLSERDEFYKCERCNNRWPIKDKIGLFCESRYWGEINQEEMNEILEKFKENPDNLEFIKEKYDVAYRFSCDPSRADWRFYLPVDKNWKVLDAGCGMGGMTFPLAKIVGLTFPKTLETVKSQSG